MIKINVIIFDFDGVIVDSGSDIANAVAYTLEKFDRSVLSEEEITSYVGRGVENLIRRSFKDCSDEIIMQAMPVYKEYYSNNCVIKTKLCSNVKETLEYFKEKKLALVTNKPESMTGIIIKKLGIEHCFELIVGPESVKNMKPDPEGLFKVLDYFGEKPENTIMIGDSHTDIQAGKRAGTHTCGITSGLGAVDELIKAEPDFTIDDMGKLKMYIR